MAGDRQEEIPNRIDTNRNGRKRTFWQVRLTKTQISLRIRAVWSEFSLSIWRDFACVAVQIAPSDDSDQTTQMRRLVWIFAGRTFRRYVFRRCGSSVIMGKTRGMQTYVSAYSLLACSTWAAKWEDLRYTMCAQRRLRSACAWAQSDQRLRCPPDETLDLWLPTESPGKTPIRLRGYAGYGGRTSLYSAQNFTLLLIMLRTEQ